MKSAPQSSDGDKQTDKRTDKQTDKQANPHGEKQPRSLQDAAAPLPHETDQSAQSQQEEAPRHVGKQAHQDLERGLKDTDRRGGGEYQEQTQNDAHTDVNSDGEGKG